VWPSFISMVASSDGAGLGCFQHHPGERFMRCFIDRCIDEDGLQAFEVEGLSGLISVSGLASMWPRRVSGESAVRLSHATGPLWHPSQARPIIHQGFLGGLHEPCWEWA
jgi:hypothetical protein